MRIKTSCLFASLIISILLFATSITAHASLIMHSGSNCQAANQAQANLMIWSKDGIENNAPIDLYVMCPVDFNWHDWDGTPRIDIGAAIYMPPGYGASGAPGPFCVARFTTTLAISSAATNDVTVVDQVGFNIGTFMGSSTMGTTQTGQMSIDAVQDFTQAHLLCLLPKNGGTLQSYFGNQI